MAEQLEIGQEAEVVFRGSVVALHQSEVHVSIDKPDGGRLFIKFDQGAAIPHLEGKAQFRAEEGRDVRA